ncbi:MAG TPA: ABC transporter permease subunit [Candidatus Limnocylindrales bacterium]|nr:ABC transporter permease subunit [Candidatus Limnocylindrales bacterium]
MTTVVANGAAVGYSPTRTHTFASEFVRQWKRRRTQLALGFMVLLPLILLVAFEFGDDDDGGGGGGRGQFSALVDVAVAGGLNFALFTVFVSSSFLLVVIFALFHGDTIASEASWGSLRYLLAIPVPRARLLGIKLSVALTYSLLSVALLIGTALALGTLRYGWHPLQSGVSADVPTGEGVLRLLGVAGYMSVTLLVVAGIAFLLSVMTDAPLGAVGGAVLLFIVSSILDQITALGELRNFLPTHFVRSYLGLLTTPMQFDGIVKGTILALAYAALFWGIAFWRFIRKDVTS